MFDSEHSRWQAVQSRSKSAASAFVYAVITTKIFCRPTCPARLARRANIRFYDSSSKAVSAGFRPCKRCKPEDTRHDDSDSANPQRRVVKKACRYIEESKGAMTLKEVAHKVGISPRYLHGIFKDITGSTPATYAARFKGGDGGSNATPTTSQEPSPLSAADSYDTINNGACDEVTESDFAFYTSVEAYEAAEYQLNALGDERFQLNDWVPASEDGACFADGSLFTESSLSTDVDFLDTGLTPCHRLYGMEVVDNLQLTSKDQSSFLEFPWPDDLTCWKTTAWSANEHVQV